MQARKVSIGKVEDMLKLSFWVPSGKGGKGMEVSHVIWKVL